MIALDYCVLCGLDHILYIYPLFSFQKKTSLSDVTGFMQHEKN